VCDDDDDDDDDDDATTHTLHFVYCVCECCQ